MAAHFPLTVYFDASCRLCASEMQNIKQHDHKNQLVMVDCSAADFDDSPYQALGITRATMMHRLHLQDAKGQWLVGVDAFVLLYDTVGLSCIAKLWGHPVTKPWAKRFYPWIADHRYLLSWFGLPELINAWSRHAAKKAEQRSRLCQEGLCKTDD